MQFAEISHDYIWGEVVENGQLPGTGGKEEHAVQEVKPIQDDCLECESKDCAYNRDGICRFSKVFDRGPSITEEDGCTEFVIRHTY